MTPDAFLADLAILFGRISNLWWARPLRGRLRTLQAQCMQQSAQARRTRRALDEVVADALEQEQIALRAAEQIPIDVADELARLMVRWKAH